MSRDATYYSRFALAVSGTTQNTSGPSTKSGDTEVLADFAVDYGLPGKPDYTYKRPFDYFAFQATASTGDVFENVMTRGLTGSARRNGAECRALRANRDQKCVIIK